jgi:hypothetical protein
MALCTRPAIEGSVVVNTSIPFAVQVGLPNADSSDVATPQAVRAAGVGFVVSVANDLSTVADLTASTPPSPAQVVTAPITAGNSQTTDTNLKFVAKALGSTSVSATTPDASSSGLATIPVNVTSSGGGGGC